MSGFALDGWLAGAVARIDAHLAGWLRDGDVEPTALHQAIRYATLEGGKRLRAALAFGAAEALGRSPTRALPVAAAVELAHAYSLVHDDLPAMDDAKTRRGKPAVHVRYGEATGILTGDALLAAAFEALAVPEMPIEVVRMLAQGLGSLALVGGQADDLDFSAKVARLHGPAPSPRPTILAAVVSIHERKTVAMFAFAVEGAARVCAASSDERDALGRFARHYGRAFQIADDLDDADDPGECSILRALEPAEAVARAQRELVGASRALERFGSRAEPLGALTAALEAGLPR